MVNSEKNMPRVVEHNVVTSIYTSVQLYIQPALTTNVGLNINESYTEI